jgi:hypothetical protein
MPKELTHWILADRALAGLSDDSRLRKLILEHHDCYLGGAVLPDTLMHLLRGAHSTSALALAKRFHDTAGNSFTPLTLAEQRFASGLPPPILACLLGVITHMQVDIVFHPFVYALAGACGIDRHYQIETGMDVHFLQHATIPPVRHVADLITPATRKIFIESCAMLFDPDDSLPRLALEQALKLHSRFQRMYDRTFWKLAVRFVARLAGSPFREQRYLFYPLSDTVENSFFADAVEWRHPISGEPRQTSLEQLADEAVQRIVTLFEYIEAAGSLAEGLAGHIGENLLTGMHGASLPAR